MLTEDAQGQGRVFVGCEVVEQAEFLENHADPAAKRGKVLSRQPCGIDPEHRDPAGRGS
jgi:hypothetical protein